MGCDHHVGGGARARPISIHAPQWGATHAETIEVSANVEISIHAPQWGATSKSSPARPHPPNFNPRTPVGCDGLISAIGGALASFQSTHPSGVRRGSPVQVGRAAYFNPRTPVGCDTLTMTASPAWWYFNPRTPVGCDDDKTLQRAFTSEFQSTHPSGVRPYVADIREMPRCISIHAPQWGATFPSRWFLRMFHVFQSTHPSGVRPAIVFVGSIERHFNPRTPVGCDPAFVPMRRTLTFQSTHPSGVRLHVTCRRLPAPTFQSTHPSGVRQYRQQQLGGCCQFQSTHPSGVRPNRADTARPATVFQSTHPSGVRPSGTRPVGRSWNFNPRTPVGCDSGASGYSSRK